MDLLSSLIQAGGGDLVGRLAKNFGVSSGQAQSALESLLPAILGGVKQNARQPGGLESLIGALSGGHHQKYLDDPSTLSAPETVQDGNGILGHIFGSKEKSREVAAAASSQTGVGADILKKMLPIVAGLVMAQLSKKAATSAPAPAPGAAPAGGGMLGGLTGILDLDGDGKVEAGDLLGMVKKMV
jgi:hypothetical protein